MRTWWLMKAAKVAVTVVLMVAVLSGAVMLLWNALIPDIFGGPTVTYIQALGLFVLSHILVRGVRFGYGHHYGGHYRWKHKLEEKLAAMTPEEREKFREEYRRRCGWDPGASSEKDGGSSGKGMNA